MRAKKQTNKKQDGSTGTLMVRGREISYVLRELKHSELQFYPDNPRIYSIVRSGDEPPTQEEIRDHLIAQKYVKKLRDSIKLNGGLREAVYVLDQSYVVIEGNSRLAAYRLLAREDPIKWSMVRCKVLPADLDDSTIFAVLGQLHITGKKDWVPFEQAGFLYRRHRQQNVPISTLSEEIGLGTRTVSLLIRAHAFMLEHKETTPERWSYYFEYLKSRKVAAVREEHPELDALVVEKVRSGEISHAVKIRDDLPIICSGPGKVLMKFLDDACSFEQAVEQAIAGGADDGNLKRLTAFRKWIVGVRGPALAKAEGERKAKLTDELWKIQRRVNALLYGPSFLRVVDSAGEPDHTCSNLLQRWLCTTADNEEHREITIDGLLGQSAQLTVFIGFAAASLLHSLSFADVLDEETGRGYQRRFNPQHSLDFRRYIQRTSSTTIPLTFNLRPRPDGAWRLTRGAASAATLSVSAAAGKVLAQVDCQHRLGYLADLDVSLSFMCFIGLSEREEMEIFKVINSKAKGLSQACWTFTKPVSRKIWGENGRSCSSRCTSTALLSRLGAGSSTSGVTRLLA